MLLAIILCAGVWGCYDKPHQFQTNQEFTPAEIDVVQAAADEWCTASDGRACARIGVDGDSDLTLAKSMPPRCSPNAIGLHSRIDYNSGASHITILDQRNQDEWLVLLYNVARHELGHHWGCGDIAGTPMDGIVENAIGTQIDLTKLGCMNKYGL